MYLATVSKELRIYDCESWTQSFNHGCYEDVVRHVEWSDGGKYFLQVSPAGRIEIYSATQDGVRCLQCIPEGDSSAASFHRGGHREVAVGCRTGKIYIWDTKRKAINKTFTEASSGVKFIDFNCKNTFLAAGLENGDTTIYGVTTNHQIGIINIPSGNRESAVRLNKVSALKFHNELRSILALASDEGSVLVRDLGNGKNKLFMKDAHKSIVSGVAFSKVNHDVMLSCGYDRKMQIYDIRKEIIVSSVVADFALSSIDINVDNYVALGTKRGQVLVYDLRKVLEPVKIINDHTSIVSKVAFQPEVDKRKRYLALDASLKESFSPKLSVAAQQAKECKTPEAVKSYEFIDQFSSPVMEPPSPKREKLDFVDGSKDSFLVNIVGPESNSYKNSQVMFVDSTDENCNPHNTSLNVSNLKLRNKNMRKSISLGDKLSECGTSASTPIIGKITTIHEGTPSPITCRNGVGDFNIDSNDHTPPKEICSLVTSPLKKTDSVDSASGVETVKYTTNIMADLGNELKDFITYSIFDVLEQSKNNFMNITMQQTKNRLHLEDQISILAQRVQELQHNQNVLIEENKKLSIEVELLRSTKDN